MSSEKPNIQRFEGVPRKTGRRQERSRWKQFLNWISGRAELADDLAEEYASAYVSEFRADADMKANQAAEVAAKVDQEKAKATQAVFDLIDQAVPRGENDLLAQELKIRELCHQFPALQKALEDIQTRGQRLSELYGTRIDVRRAEEKTDAGSVSKYLSLPPEEDPKK